jgi:uncharacterized integral membrane protein
MSTNEVWTILGIGIVLALFFLIWLSVLASALTLAFTGFVMGLPVFVALLLFVLFPPTLIVFLSGYAMIKTGFADKLLRD